MQKSYILKIEIFSIIGQVMSTDPQHLVTRAVEILGGREAVAVLADVTPGAVWVWERNGIFPADTRDLIDHEFALRGRKPLPRNLWRMKRHPKLTPRDGH